jgi:hypothetical protein
MESLRTFSAVFEDMSESRDYLNSRLSDRIRDLHTALGNRALERRSQLAMRQLIRREVRRLCPAFARRGAYQAAASSMAA